MSQELQDKLTEYLENSISIRFDFIIPEFGDGPVDLHNALVNIQRSLTYLEDYLSKSMRAKLMLERKLNSAKMNYQESWDKAIVKTLNRPTLSEYSTGKERAAEANLATLTQVIALRKLEEVKSFADEAVDIIRLHYYGLDKVRQDIRKRLDLAQADAYA